ncbi:Hsp20 family protein [Vibrio scophthalmi]|uniref:Small heat shock protein IbpA n=2 Tax=Vibrio scophthalmi TaxID=45658 RepID=A0A1B1NND0_9VIBR|nr:Hsp20 family protein [Vibrio scophthalmi]ANS85248.1 Small heat shock protein IbpA [Vibrio scophthalmi]ANU36183.1 Small heat shock protein IbpA [Vibrio scophthalmi]EGU37885.1 small heat shock protein IbpA (16 kDa heat shock protein A) [Vibrio scophthalmi LMG 19158]MCY9803782.1 Hsp20 family protein [Vibrio scophthalmi]ODS11191.1 Small heat shock protein IbpA [Vibrio scophthalmi]
MRNVDISPLYRHAIGFDRLFNLVENSAKKPSQTGYPPYNIEQKDEHNYRITMAVAGFSEDALTLTQNENMLIVSGEIKASETKPTYVYQGIAERNFERKFQLADYVTVSAASMENGLLHIDLVREVPEAMQPRKIAINK